MELYINYANKTYWFSNASVSDTLYRSGITIIKSTYETITLVFKTGQDLLRTLDIFIIVHFK